MCKNTSKLADFNLIFPTNESAVYYFKGLREQQGLYCRDCGSSGHKWIEKKKMWQCLSCRHRMSVKVGTFMENSKMSELDWLRMIFFMMLTRQSMSALSLQSILGFSRYETVWYMLQRIRNAMGTENRRSLFQGKCDPLTMHNRKFELRFKSNAMVDRLREISLTVGNNHGSKNEMFLLAHPGLIKVNDCIQEEKGEYRYRYRSVKTYTHLAYSQSLNEGKPSKKTAKWIKNVLFNLECKLKGIHHFVMPYYLQLYIDEFVFRYNLRDESQIFKIAIETLIRPFGHDCG
jgi:hypothetical protein